MRRPELIRQAFVTLADTLVDDYDIVEFLDRLAEHCVEVLDVAEAGVMLVDAQGGLQVLASSSERMRIVELLELQESSGPCLDAHRTGTLVRAPRLHEETGRWPAFATAALAMGFESVYAVPMRLRSERIGALNLFADRPDGLSGDDEILAQAMADIATIGILHERTATEQNLLAQQLSTALNSRITIEQAKGSIAAQAEIDVDAAFHRIRAHARHNNRKLVDVAADIVARRLRNEQLGAGT